MIYLYAPFALLLIYFSIKSFRGGVNYLNYFKREVAKPASAYMPFVTVIAPCKGADEGLAGNLAAVAGQNYPEFEVIFVCDDPYDPAVQTVEEVSGKYDNRAKLVIAPKASNTGQKVANLLEAVRHIDERSEVLAFVDSDVRPHPRWLAGLVAPLADRNIGAATGYRWFVSENTGIAAEVRSAWNASIASALGPNTNSNFCWGGSAAIRRETFERLNMIEKWKGTLSDDFALTRALNAANLPIVFVPQAVLPSSGTCSWSELLEFTNRQMKITRVYAPRLWVLSFVGSGLFTFVMAASVAASLATAVGSLIWTSALFTLIVVTALSVGKAWFRFQAVMLALPHKPAALNRQFPFQLALWLVAQPLFLINCIAALISRKIRWRGIEYLMVSAEETEVL